MQKKHKNNEAAVYNTLIKDTSLQGTFFFPPTLLH